MEPYCLAAGTILYQAEWSFEEGPGTPSGVTAARAGWLATGHVGRLVAREGLRWGAIYLGLASRQGQAQIRATASGSVVDSMFPADMEAVLLPPVTPAMPKLHGARLVGHRSCRRSRAAGHRAYRKGIIAQGALTTGGS